MAQDSDFQTRILQYVKYGLSIKTTSNEGVEYYLVGISFKPSWKVISPPEGSCVSCVQSSTEDGSLYYFTETSNGIGCIFDSIEETIQYNEDIEKKIALLKEKVTELQELFATQPYERLTGLRFVFDDEKPSRGKRGRPKKERTQSSVTDTEDTSNIIEGNTDTTMSEQELHEEQENAIKENNTEEANEIDAKIAAALGKK